MKRNSSEVNGSKIDESKETLSNTEVDKKENSGDHDDNAEVKEHIYKKQELNDSSEVKKIMNTDYTSATNTGVDTEQSVAVPAATENQTPTQATAQGEDIEVTQQDQQGMKSSMNIESSATSIAAKEAEAAAAGQAQLASQSSLGQEESKATIAPTQQKEMSASEIETLKLKYLNDRDLKKLVELCLPLTEIYKEYQKLKYKNKIYSINDLVLIQNADDLHNDFIGQLTKIIRIENQGKYITLIQIKWFYKKDDLPKKKFDNILDCISDNEIFETDHLDITFVDCINGPCRLYSYHDFDKLGSVSANTYYTRAKFDTVKKRLNPPFEKWEQGCICKRPLNPDYLYIQCEICEKWLHITCVNISEDEVETIESYKCPPCLAANLTVTPKMTIKGLPVVSDERELVSSKRSGAESKKLNGKDNHSSK